ncbi:MAG: I78 family peptidase inhibitor [Hyphomonadaceae bacterium]
MKTQFFLAAAACLAFAACAPTHAGHEAPPPPTEQAANPDTADEATAQDTCGMAAFAHLIGTPAANIDRATLPPRTRIITPDMMVTQDFSAQRLNIMVGTDGIVGSMRCF